MRLSECRAALGLGVKRTPLSDLGEEGKEAAVAVAMGGRQGGSERGQVPDDGDNLTIWKIEEGCSPIIS